jgi:hypothetical protein
LVNWVAPWAAVAASAPMRSISSPICYATTWMVASEGSAGPQRYMPWALPSAR